MAIGTVSVLAPRICERLVDTEKAQEVLSSGQQIFIIVSPKNEFGPAAAMIWPLESRISATPPTGGSQVCLPNSKLLQSKHRLHQNWAGA